MRRGFARLALVAILLGYLVWLFVRLYRPDAADGMGGTETLLAWAALMGATFLPHAGVALAAGLALCALVRAWRPVLAGLPLLALSLGPWLWSFLPARAAPAQGETLLVLSANLLGTSRSDVELLDQIAVHEPDIIVLQEVRPAAMERLTAALGDRYHTVAAPREHLFGEAIFSKLPFTREARVILPEDGRDLPQVMAWVDWGGRELCVWDIHLHPPTGRSLVAGQARLSWEMGPLLDELGGARTPMIVAGDFNAPWGAQPLDQLRRRGYREAHHAAGRGPGASWPARGALLSLPPGIRIDHVAFSAQLECVEAWQGGPTASDHRAQFARFKWSAATR